MYSETRKVVFRGLKRSNLSGPEAVFLPKKIVFIKFTEMSSRIMLHFSRLFAQSIAAGLSGSAGIDRVAHLHVAESPIS